MPGKTTKADATFNSTSSLRSSVVKQSNTSSRLHTVAQAQEFLCTWKLSYVHISNPVTHLTKKNLKIKMWV